MGTSVEEEGLASVQKASWLVFVVKVRRRRRRSEEVVSWEEKNLALCVRVQVSGRVAAKNGQVSDRQI